MSEKQKTPISGYIILVALFVLVAVTIFLLINNSTLFALLFAPIMMILPGFIIVDIIR